MHISKIKITNLRNLIEVQIELGKRFNVFVGENGSGKTSLLEAIYILALSRSFRSHLTNHIINYNASALTIFANIDSHEKTIALGIEKSHAGTKLRMDGRNINQVATIALQLPLQLMSADSYKLLNAGPGYRRRFIDWGLFHVKQSFYPVWLEFQKALQQRNSALKQNVDKRQLSLWSDIFVQIALAIDSMRYEYIEDLIPIAQELIAHVLEVKDLKLIYQPGWDKRKELSEVLKNQLYQDLRVGYTQQGPQRADLMIHVNGKPVQYILSRGQQKLLALSLQIAQGKLLQNWQQKKCIYLIDDLSSELDQNYSKKLFLLLRDLDAQVLITTVDNSQLPTREQACKDLISMFHVKHGEVFGLF